MVLPVLSPREVVMDVRVVPVRENVHFRPVRDERVPIGMAGVCLDPRGWAENTSSKATSRLLTFHPTWTCSWDRIRLRRIRGRLHGQTYIRLSTAG